MTEPIAAGPPLGADALRAEDIFRRYPDVSEDEVAHALAFLKTGRHLEVGRVTGAPDLRANVAAFRARHGAKLTLGVADYLKFAVGVTLFIGGLFLVLGRW